MSSFTATKWRFRLALGFLIFAAAAAWAASYYHIAYIFSDSARGNEDVAKLLTLVDILSGSLLAALLFAAVFIFRPLVLGLGRQHRILESLESRSRAVVESAPDGILAFDEKGIIESFNPAAEKLFACSASEVIGKSIQTIIPGYRGSLEVNAETSASRITGIERQIVGHRWDGSTFDMDLTVSELMVDDKKLTMAIIRDVSARTEAEQQMKESEERLRLIVEHSPDAIAIHAAGTVIFVNPRGVELLGAQKAGDILGRPILDFVPHEMRKTVIERIQTMIQKNEKVPMLEERFVRLDGKAVDVEVIAIPLSVGGKPAIQVVARDISRRKAADAEIRKSLKEKEVLLKEIHHRVKNNLQVIVSLLDLQSDRVEDRVALEALRECQNRVKSISLIHERLYESRDLAQVDFPEYIRMLMDNLLRSYGVEPDRVRRRIEVVDIRLGLDTAIPCGLIIHELVSNALKHAFPGGRSGEIRVGIYADGDRNFLVVSDNGKGFGGVSDFRTVSSLGLQLVDTLTSQINGNIDFHTNGGTEFIISFQQA